MKLEKRKYICDICKQMFLRRRYFVQHFRRHTQTTEDHADNTIKLMNLLPKNWEYVVKSYEPRSQKNNFVATVLVSGMSNSDQIKEWMKQFMNINRCNYILKYLDSRESRFAKSKHVYACRYLSRKCNKSSCQSCIRFIIRRNWENSAHFGIVNIKYVHNHSPDCAAILKYRTPSEDVQQFFRTMFTNGFSPSQAYNSYKQHLYVQYSNNYEMAISDRALNPDQRWVYYFYQKLIKEKNGPTASEHMITTVKTSVNEFNERHEQNFCYYEQLDDDHFSVVVLTPLMTRALRLSQAKDVMFINYESQVSRFGLHVFLLFVSCCVGGIPAGIVITSDDSELVISKGFQLYFTLVSEPLNPNIIFTADCPPLRNALQSLFPSSRLLLNVFQILEAGWKWLWKLENAIDSKYRKSFYNYMQRMIYCIQPELFDIIYTEFLNDSNVQKYKNYIDYVKKLHHRRNEWAVCFHNAALRYEKNSKNVVEECMKVFKEKMFKKLKSYNPSQLFHFIVGEFNTYYERKLFEVAINKNCNYFNQRLTVNEEEIAKYKVQYISDSVVMLTNIKKNVHYIVNEDVNVCSCYLGEVGLACKHLTIVNNHLNVRKLFNCSISEEERQQLYYVADGTVCNSKMKNQLILVSEEEVDAPNMYSDEVSVMLEGDSSGRNELDFSNLISDGVKEEIVLLLDEEDDPNEFIQEKDVEVVSEHSVTAFDRFQKLMDAFTNRIKSDIPFYRLGLELMNNRLESLMQQPNTSLYEAMVDFGKNDFEVTDSLS